MSYNDVSQLYGGGTISYAGLWEPYNNVETLLTMQVDGSVRLQIQYSAEVVRCMGEG